MKISFILTKLKEYSNPICERCNNDSNCENCSLHNTVINILDRLLDGEPIEKEKEL